jgi:hypothetical protein
MEVEYDEEANRIVLSFPQEGVIVGLPANHVTLGLWKKLGILRYQRELWEKQGRKCADCGKYLEKSRGSKLAYLHHDPPLGAPGSKVLDSKGTTNNRVLCYLCHNKHHAIEQSN